MKISKIPGLGRFGVFVDDLDLNTVTDEEWAEIGQAHLQNLVTIIRNVNIDYKRYAELMCKWASPRYHIIFNIFLKYGKTATQALFNNELEPEDVEALMNARKWSVDKRYPMVGRVSPAKNSRGQSIGIFGDGELKWHSNECGNYWFAPGVSLLGVNHMVGSSTGFLTTVDYYESLSETFRSELDEMVVVHNYEQSRLNPEYGADQEGFYKRSMCVDDDARVPLIIQSPGGIKGIHLGINTFDRIEGMSKEESDKIFSTLEKGLFREEYTYHHWYEQDNDLLIFDNSITLHNRTIKDNGHIPDRLGYRIQFDYSKLVPEYNPYYQEEFNAATHDMMEKYKLSIADMDIDPRFK